LIEFDAILDSNEKNINEINIRNQISSLRNAIKIKRAQYEKLLERIRSLMIKINSSRDLNIFGYYTYYTKNGFRNTNHIIQINLLTCIFFAKEKQIDPNFLILSTYIHELSHFQSHEGKDKDGKKWDTFADVDEAVREGIAQYFSCEYFKKIEKKEVFDCIENLKDELGNHIFGKVYREYLDYQSFTREQVYFAFVKFRRNNLIQSKDFLDLLKSAENELPGKI
jgi:hypothetical protein